MVLPLIARAAAAAGHTAAKAKNARRRVTNAVKALNKRADALQGTAYGARLERVAGELENLKQDLYQDRSNKSWNLEALALAENVRNNSVMDDFMQADILMRGTVGDRVYASTRDIWEGLPYDQREDAILDAFKVQTLPELFDKIESNLGGAIYGGDTTENYDKALVLLAGMLNG